MKDFSVIGVGKREELRDKDDEKIIGTWKELNVRKLFVEKGLEERVNNSSEDINKSEEQSLNRKKSQNEIDKRIAESRNQKGSNVYIRKEQHYRQ